MDEDPDSTQILDLNTAPTLASKAKLMNQVPTRDTQPIHSPDDDTVAIGKSVRQIKFEGLVDEAPPSTEDQAQMNFNKLASIEPPRPDLETSLDTSRKIEPIENQ